MILAGGLILWSCTKEEAVPTAQKGTMDLKGAPGTPTPTLTLSYAPAPGIVGQDVTIKAWVTYLGVDLTCGHVQLFYAVDAVGNPCPVASVVSWVNPWGQPKAAPGGTYTTSYTAAGYYGWRAQYESSGPGCDYQNLTGNDAVTLDIQIVENDCTEPLTITPFLVSASSDDGKLFKFTTKWVVKACEDFTDLKTQGGLTAGSVVLSTEPLASTIRSTKQNVIINWKEPVVESGDEFVYVVVFTRALKNTCYEYDITGAWSAKAWHMVPVDDGFGNIVLVKQEYVAGYNNKIYYKTPCY